MSVTGPVAAGIFYSDIFIRT